MSLTWIWSKKLSGPENPEIFFDPKRTFLISFNMEKLQRPQFMLEHIFLWMKKMQQSALLMPFKQGQAFARWLSEAFCNCIYILLFVVELTIVREMAINIYNACSVRVRMWDWKTITMKSIIFAFKYFFGVGVGWGQVSRANLNNFLSVYIDGVCAFL
jgi:hypothetical protein